ncbi:hypothetical protein [Candidatus Cardinium hertigii]|uniref:Uncharacterized protein n=1 Tax=Candidatus Cardinium hertigii TaxID=247481 RepID=A0A2Z3LGH3_9BACT|nr:hypothetical protein [Candidatus Cardinium hertigii]AWN81484.1 hypothetical protein DK880_00148 [Candidatus Cardinium hertigii]
MGNTSILFIYNYVCVWFTALRMRRLICFLFIGIATLSCSQADRQYVCKVPDSIKKCFSFFGMGKRSNIHIDNKDKRIWLLKFKRRECLVDKEAEWDPIEVGMVVEKSIADFHMDRKGYMNEEVWATLTQEERLNIVRAVVYSEIEEAFRIKFRK